MEKFCVAKSVDLPQVLRFYQAVCERQSEDQYGPDWHYGIYPSEKELKEFVVAGELHFCRVGSVGFPSLQEGTVKFDSAESDQRTKAQTLHDNLDIVNASEGELAEESVTRGDIVAAAVLERHADPMYSQGHWKVPAASDQILTLHLLAVHPDLRGQNLAGKMLEYMVDYGRRGGFLSIQLDVLKGNLPAERLYLKHGFEFVEECEVWYADTGTQTVHLYEKDLRRQG